MRNFGLGKGFTLVEMLVVVIIIGVLVAIAMPALFSAINDARCRTCGAIIRNIESAAALYASQNNGVMPASITTVTQDTKYFPDGEPKCPYDISYAWKTGANGTVEKSTHFGSWPDTTPPHAVAAP